METIEDFNGNKRKPDAILTRCRDVPHRVQEARPERKKPEWATVVALAEFTYDHSHGARAEKIKKMVYDLSDALTSQGRRGCVPGFLFIPAAEQKNGHGKEIEMHFFVVDAECIR